MEVLWRRGNCNVRQVVEQLPHALAYTTVMTTLDRLFKKGLLDREKEDRAFVYGPRLSRAEWERQRAGQFVASFFGSAPPARQALVSYLLAAVEEYDAGLLDTLTHEIQIRRSELEAADPSDKT